MSHFPKVTEGFPKVTEDSNKFAEEFDITIQAYQPGFSDLYQLIHMLIGEGEARHWIRIAGWELPNRDLENQISNYLEEARELARKLHEQFPRLFQSLSIGAKFTLAHKGLTKLFMSFIIGFR